MAAANWRVQCYWCSAKCDPNCDSNSDSYCYCDGHSHSHRDGNCHCYRHGDIDSEDDGHTPTSSHTGAETVTRSPC